MILSVWLLAATLRAVQPADPHNGEFTAGLGVQCAHCHGPTRSRQYEGSARMAKMVAGLNKGVLGTMGGVTCMTCHRGWAGHPGGSPSARARHPLVPDWPASLALSEEAARKPARTIYKNLKLLGDIDAGTIKKWMTNYATSLGVGCDHCHVAGDWSSDTKQPKRTARMMISLMDEFPKYFEYATAAAFGCDTCHQGATKPPR